MKRIFLASMYVIASSVIFSCTDDTMEKSKSNNAAKVVASDPGEPTPIPPRKP